MQILKVLGLCVFLAGCTGNSKQIKKVCTSSLDFCTKHNICFFKQDPKFFSQIEVENAIDLFIDVLPYLTSRKLSHEEIEHALSGLIVQWSPVVIDLEGKRYLGLQLDKWMVVVLYKELNDTAFFHELLHVVDKNVYNIDDVKHEDEEWWACEEILNEIYYSSLVPSI